MGGTQLQMDMHLLSETFQKEFAKSMEHISSNPCKEITINSRQCGKSFAYGGGGQASSVINPIWIIPGDMLEINIDKQFRTEYKAEFIMEDKTPHTERNYDNYSIINRIDGKGLLGRLEISDTYANLIIEIPGVDDNQHLKSLILMPI